MCLWHKIIPVCSGAEKHCIINPRRMREGYSSHCVCVSVATLTATYLVFFVEIQMSLSFLCSFQHMHCVDFVESDLFKSSGDVC